MFFIVRKYVLNFHEHKNLEFSTITNLYDIPLYIVIEESANLRNTLWNFYLHVWLSLKIIANYENSGDYS